MALIVAFKEDQTHWFKKKKKKERGKRLSATTGCLGREWQVKAAREPRGNKSQSTPG